MSETFEIELERIAHGGAAIGRHAGRTIFVNHALPGERVLARITQEKERYAYATPIEILRRSHARVEPHCLHATPQGGGPGEWQIIAYEQQLIYKREIVSDQLQRIGGIENPVVHPVIAAPEAWGYRRNMTFQINRDGETGFYRYEGRGVVPVNTCYLMHPALQDLYAELDLASPDINRVRFVMGTEAEDRMVVLEVREDDAPEIETDLPLSINLLLPDNEPVNLIGNPNVTYKIYDRLFRVTTGSYFYPNAEMVPVIINEVLKRLDLQGSENVLELYSGVGTLTAFIAERADMVVSVESYPPAVTDADMNLEDIENVELVEGSAEEVLDDLIGPFDAVVVDPPPAGLSTDVLDALVRLESPRMVYVSADPATLGRDAKRLAREGYQLIDVQPLDMEPQTPHIVSVALLTR